MGDVEKHEVVHILTLFDLQGAFFILVLGWLTGTMSFFMEYVIKKLNKKLFLIKIYFHPMMTLL